MVANAESGCQQMLQKRVGESKQNPAKGTFGTADRAAATARASSVPSVAASASTAADAAAEAAVTTSR